MRIRYVFKELSNKRKKAAKKKTIEEINKRLDAIEEMIEEINKELKNK